MDKKILPGRPSPLGATFDGKGVNFAVYSESATDIELCLFDALGQPQAASFRLPEFTGFVWHGYLPGLNPGQLYGYRAHGEFNPSAGLRHNPAKLLLDPYARAICGKMDWNAPIFSYPLGDEQADLAFDNNDNATGVPKGVVLDDRFDWEDDRLLNIPWNDTIIYEVHVRGFTMKHPEIPEELRGTYAGFAHPAAIDYLKKLGVTAVELLPVHDFLREKHLLDKGLTNYWGYNTRNFFSPTSLYSSSGDRGEQVTEFKSMVKALHCAGLEVILDVVYNHTCEGNHLGPSISFRGLDNRTYYHLVTDDSRYYMDYTGTGNSLNVNHPQVLKLITDSLRYWVTEMHVDGFRFDLASVLARELYDVDKLAAFFDIIHQDPILAEVKLIAEPWDVGMGGYQVGNFPVLWSEWNGKYRDNVRKFWKGDDGQLQELSSRLMGSSDLYQDDGREPYNSINLIVAHDGFTLADLVSYNDKHNDANGEDNNDGANDNNSWNCGAEGPTDDAEVNALRLRQMKNLMATLLLSQGVPMICGGDEVARSQGGNNNAYCQDNEISWHDWNIDERKNALLEFTKQLIQIRKQHPNFRRHKFVRWRKLHPETAKDAIWFSPEGEEMTEENWHAPFAKTFALLLDGSKLEWLSKEGGVVTDDSFLLLVNAHYEAVEFKLPKSKRGDWEFILTTSEDATDEIRRGKVEARALSLFIRKLQG
ncbi:MAG TPA: glycogen debranching protein GlgX [Candidatus Kapabacteria bacterium]|nr:glycogen debranching protein GlgX [Candidatus Kapabacteria bacterium]